jgi:hypothetical protein
MSQVRSKASELVALRGRRNGLSEAAADAVQTAPPTIDIAAQMVKFD